MENIFSHCMAYVKSVQQAEELTQDIFIKLWQSRHRLTEVERPEDYIFIIARNTIFRSFRKKVNELTELTETDKPDTSWQPHLQAEYKDSYALLLKGIEQLPEKRRMIFKMSRLEGLSHEEIARRTGLHKVTIAQYIMLSLEYLQDYIKRHSDDLILFLFFIFNF